MNRKKRVLLLIVSLALLALLAFVCIYFKAQSNPPSQTPEGILSPSVTPDEPTVILPDDGDEAETGQEEEEEDTPSPKTDSQKPDSQKPSDSEPPVAPISPLGGSQKYTAEETEYLLAARKIAQKVNHTNEKTQELLDRFSPGEETATAFEALAGEFGVLYEELSGVRVPKKFSSAHQALSDAVKEFQTASSLFVKVARDRDVEALKEAEAAIEAGNSKIQAGSDLLSMY